SLLYIYIYKLVNSKGFAYLKLDDCAFSGQLPWETDFPELRPGGRGSFRPKRLIKSHLVRRWFVKRVDLWSIEDEYSKELYERRYMFLRGKIVTSFNGHTVDLGETPAVCPPEEKENIISTAGRLGTYQKATEILLEGFRSVAEKSNYSLHLAGTVEPSFDDFARNFLSANSHLRDRVFFHGQLGRRELFQMYGRSKIFCLPSRYDSLPNVFPESMYYGNAVVTTNNVSLKYHIDKFRIGLTFEKDNPEELAEALMTLINDERLLRETGERAHAIADNFLNWDTIVMKLHGDINTLLKSRAG
ncbi:MAG: glycosyltransferase family 4 protein, partial [Bacteroidales bacterium]|nr:glycosyltransferase family 4 protein [Bacteroidales bacterium]